MGHVQPFWSWRTMRRPRDTIVPPEVPRFDALAADEDDAIACTWLGQSTCFLQLGGARVLLDPVFATQLAPPFGPRRVHTQPATLKDLGKIDLVVCVSLCSESTASGALAVRAERPVRSQAMTADIDQYLARAL